MVASVVTDRYIDALREIVTVVEVSLIDALLSFDDDCDAEITSVSVGEVENNGLFDSVHVSVNGMLIVMDAVDERCVLDTFKLFVPEGLVVHSSEGVFEISTEEEPLRELEVGGDKVRELENEAGKDDDFERELENVSDGLCTVRDVLSVIANVVVADRDRVTADDSDGEYVIVWVELGVPVPSVRNLE